MQKNIKWILVPVAFLLLFSCGFGVFALIRGAHASAPGRARVTVLAAGVDLAAENTDVLMLVTLDTGEKSITILQIPRDTYFSADTAQKKINQLYPHYRRTEKDPVAALSAVANELSATLGVRIDHVAVVDLDTAAEVVDAMGGVAVDIPVAIRQMVPNSDRYIELSPGYKTLCGEEAVAFLRHRVGYTEGDLGRINAQRILLTAVYRKVRDEMSLSLMGELIRKGYRGICTDMPLNEQLKLAGGFYAARREYTLTYATLPGEAVQKEESAGIWYYVVNKYAAQKLLSTYFGADGFDPDARMLDPSRAHFKNVYYDKNFSYSVKTE